MNMNCILAVVVLLFGKFSTEIYASGTVSDPFLQYVKQGQEAVLQCKYERERLKWYKYENIILASENTVIYPTKHSVSVTSTGLYYRLHVIDAQPEDEGTYNCLGGLNENYYIRLFLYVRPIKLYFFGLTNNKLKGTEGVDLPIRCIANGGKPPPDVSTLDNGTRMNGTQEVSYIIPRISRDYHQKTILCNATSDALDNPMTTTVQIYLNLKPLTPNFNRNELSTEETVPLTVSCTSYGSLPAANFTWTIDGNVVASSSMTSTSVTESNDTITVKSTLTSSVNKSHNKKSIICIATNSVGSVSANKTLDVKYAPDIKVNSPIYTQKDDDRTVTCNPSGNPDNYTYHKWQHKSKYGEIIREFAGNKTLRLPDVSVMLRYQDTGEYLCIASNGIKDKDNKLEQTGSGDVTVHAQPVFTINRFKQFGEFDKDVDIYVNVYSVPKFDSFLWTRNGIPITTQNSAKYKSSSSPSKVKYTFHGNEVQLHELDGYTVTLTISDLEADDFTNYTVKLRNTFNSSIYTIILESASRPEIPGNFSMVTLSSTSITVQWDPKSGGGYKQVFYIQYRVQGSSEWTNVSAGEEDINEQKRRRTYEVKPLERSTAYELRMYAENTAMKRSNFTDVLIEFTSSSDAGSSTGAVIGGVAGCLIAIIIVLLVIVCVLKKRKERATPSMKLRTSSEAGEDDGLKDNILYESSQSDGLKTNALYQSAGPDFESKTSTSCEYAVVQKTNTIYAEVNKDAKPKKAKAKTQKDQKEKPKKDKKVKAKAVNNNPEDEYANSALPLQNLNDGEYANSSDTQGSSGHNTNAQGLEYADLTFRQIPAKNKKQVIHGNDERTIYADVDHTKKAPPPPQESEYEETNIKHGKIA